MILLDSRFCGYDLEVMGFPSVQTCMAVVLETKDWLVGWHAMANTAASIRADAAVFGGYATGMGTSKRVRLYGVTHPNRHATMDLLKREMRVIARSIGYRGRVSTFLMPMRRTPQEDYVQFTRRGGGRKSEVCYVDQQSVVHAEESIAVTKTRHQVIANGTLRPLSDQAFDESTQQFVATGVSPIRTSVNVMINALTTISDKDWTSFSA